jgi:hypothetical protein
MPLRRSGRFADVRGSLDVRFRPVGSAPDSTHDYLSLERYRKCRVALETVVERRGCQARKRERQQWLRRIVLDAIPCHGVAYLGHCKKVDKTVCSSTMRSADKDISNGKYIESRLVNGFDPNRTVPRNPLSEMGLSDPKLPFCFNSLKTWKTQNRTAIV